jgi:hypothetical protein
MYVEKKSLIIVVVLAVVVLGVSGWTIVSLRQAATDAREAAAAAAASSKSCRPCSAGLTRAAIEESLAPLRADVAGVLAESRGARDDLTALRSRMPDLEPLTHFLRFADAYSELLLEDLARKGRLDIGAARAAVERMFEGNGGKPEGWFWGPEAPSR